MERNRVHLVLAMAMALTNTTLRVDANQPNNEEINTFLESGVNSAIQGFPRVLIHKFETKNTQVKTVITEICRTSKVIPINDKSVKGSITTNYADATTDEIYAGILTKARLKSRFLADNLLWIEAVETMPDLHKRINVGNTDKSSPYSIDEQRQEKLRVEQRKRALRQAELEAAQEAEREARFSTSLGGPFLVPPPPPYTPSFSPDLMP